MSTPASTIYVCSGVRLNNSYEHTIYFESPEAQLQYFAGKVVRTFSAYTYLRKAWNIKLQASYEDARKWSYLYFQNASGKIYYYFINQVEYISETTVELQLELDVMQTYLDDYTLQRCFVEREHVADDSIGLHTVEEGLEIGDLKVLEETSVGELNDMCILILSTVSPLYTQEGDPLRAVSKIYDGVYSGLGIYAIALQDYVGWDTKLQQLDEWGLSDSIITMWMYPKSLVKLPDGATWEDGEIGKIVQGSYVHFEEIERNTKLTNDYEPHNNKLLTYPYNFLYLSNNSGGASVYRYERFGHPEACNFKILGALSPEGSVKIYPINYNGSQHNYEEGLTLTGYPTCAWNQDVYKLWLAQNQNQQTLSFAMSGLKIVGGVAGTVATGGLSAMVSASGVASGASEIASLMAQRSDKEIQPPQAKGTHSPSINVSNNFQTFTFQKKCVTEEYAKMLDSYFDLYGYKVNTVKVPNQNVRENWTYTKTIGCHVTGDFCVEDLTKIESIYNKGITFWKNGDNIGKYELSNKTL